MKFSNTAPSNASYEKPASGWYGARLVGFAFVGTHDDENSKFGPRPRVMLRWELYNGMEVVKDAKGYVITVSEDKFTASVRGEKNRLRSCLELHGISLPEGVETDSTEWLGKCVMLFVKISESGKTAYVDAFEAPAEGDTFPPQVLKSEHWEPADNTPPPEWAQWALGRSTDLAHLGKTKGGTAPANGSAQRATGGRPGPASGPAGSRPGAATPRPGTTPLPDDDGEIPF